MVVSVCVVHECIYICKYFVYVWSCLPTPKARDDSAEEHIFLLLSILMFKSLLLLLRYELLLYSFSKYYSSVLETIQMKA